MTGGQLKPIRPAAMSYERALEIALAVYDEVDPVEQAHWFRDQRKDAA